MVNPKNIPSKQAQQCAIEICMKQIPQFAIPQGSPDFQALVAIIQEHMDARERPLREALKIAKKGLWEVSARYPASVTVPDVLSAIEAELTEKE